MTQSFEQVCQRQSNMYTININHIQSHNNTAGTRVHNAMHALQLSYSTGPRTQHARTRHGVCEPTLEIAAGC